MHARDLKKAWAGRIQGSVDPDFERFSCSLDFDLRLLPDDIATNRAWAEALFEVGVYNREELASVQKALIEIEEAYAAGRLSTDPADEDVHMLTERLLTERLGAIGAAIHAGRSRNDQIVTDFKLYLKRHLRELRGSIRSLQTTLLEKAEDTVDWLMPAYTHLQRAQPVTLAHYLLSFFWALDRETARIEAWHQIHDYCPLGSGACAGSGFPIDRFRLAKRLGFKGPTPNSIDSVSNRDFAVDAANICASIMSLLSRYADDWILWSSAEFRWLRLDDAFTTGSSMMPQKRNPDSLELIRGKTARVMSAAWRLQTLLKGLPLTYVRDLQEDKEPLFDALDTTLMSLRVMRGVVKTATFNRERMAHALDVETLATDLADYLVLKGLPFREAHHTVAGMVSAAEKSGKPLGTWSLDDFRKHSNRFEGDVAEFLSPKKSVSRRDVYGGTGPTSVQEQIRRARQVLAKDALDSASGVDVSPDARE